MTPVTGQSKKSFDRASLTGTIGIILGSLALSIVLYFVLKFDVPDSFDFIQAQLALSRTLVLFWFSFLLIQVGLNFSLFRRIVVNFFQEKAAPQNLAFFRIVFMFVCFKAYTWFPSSFQLIADMPYESRRALPFMGWFIYNVPINVELYSLLTKAATVISFCAMIGFKTRIMLLLHVPLAFYLWGVPNFFGKINHNHIVIWFSVILSLSRCADVWSLDSLIRQIRKGKERIDSSVVYALPLRFAWLHLGLIYSCSGFQKMWKSGIAWALSDNMTNQLYWEWIEHYDKVPYLRIDLLPFLLHAGGLVVILFELSYIFLVFLPNARLLAAVGALSLHRFADTFLYIDFIKLQQSQLFFLNIKKLIKNFGLRSLVLPKFSSSVRFAGVVLIVLTALMAEFLLRLDFVKFICFPVIVHLLSIELRMRCSVKWRFLIPLAAFAILLYSAGAFFRLSLFWYLTIPLSLIGIHLGHRTLLRSFFQKDIAFVLLLSLYAVFLFILSHYFFWQLFFIAFFMAYLTFFIFLRIINFRLPKLNKGISYLFLGGMVANLAFVFWHWNFVYAAIPIWIAGILLFFDDQILEKIEAKVYTSIEQIENAIIRFRRQKPVLVQFNKARHAVLFKALMFFGGTQVLINMAFGIMNIDSWPFSGYPSYSLLRTESHIEMLDMHAFRGSKSRISVDSLAQGRNYRKEDIRPHEWPIVKSHREGEQDLRDQHIAAYWNLWVTQFPELKSADSVQFYLVKSPLKPEERANPSFYQKEKLITLTSNEMN